nr:hypothetical protein BaRGS_018088 [Batillaria attramentaria]
MGVDRSFSSGVSQRKRTAQASIFTALGFSPYKPFYSFEDHFSSYEDVAFACRRAGLKSCQLILGIDFSASNEWQGRKTFGGRSLHRIVPRSMNPYQKVISIMGQTLEDFSADNMIPVFGFGDKDSAKEGVFPFSLDPQGCKGFAEVLERYETIASGITLGGPTNFAPVIREAIDIVQARRTYHILIIIADGQVNEYGETVDAIMEASEIPLSIVMVGVGDGPWDMMEQFDDRLPDRQFDNFQFVNFHKVTTGKKNPEACLALHCMMEIPDQYKTIKALGYLEDQPCNGATVNDRKDKRNSPDRSTGSPQSSL